jgi:peptidoglycan hydrolase CwlO-like protein
MKALPAILFALAITALVGVSMFAIGGNAILNPKSVPVTNSPTTNVSLSNSSQDQQQLQQMQQLITQYQQREKQYQSELTDAAQRLNQANQQLDQTNQTLTAYQQLVQALQARGLIQINGDGSVFIRGRDNN